MTTLKAALQEACYMELEDIPSEEILNTDETLTFSAAFERKMKKLIRRTDHPVRHRILKSVACFLLAVFLGGSIILTFSVEARAAFVSWIRTQYENMFVYHFSSPESDTGLPSYTLGWLPEGYEEVDLVQFGSLLVSRTFLELDGDRLFYFRYNSMVDGVVSGIEANGIDPEAVVINGMAGDFYQSADESEGNTLMWFNQDENISFVIFGSFDKTVMMRIAENVILESSAN